VIAAVLGEAEESGSWHIVYCVILGATKLRARAGAGGYVRFRDMEEVRLGRTAGTNETNGIFL